MNFKQQTMENRFTEEEVIKVATRASIYNMVNNTPASKMYSRLQLFINKCIADVLVDRIKKVQDEIAKSK